MKISNNDDRVPMPLFVVIEIGVSSVGATSESMRPWKANEAAINNKKNDIQDFLEKNFNKIAPTITLTHSPAPLIIKFASVDKFFI